MTKREEAIMQEAFTIGRIYNQMGEKETPIEIQNKLKEKCELAAKAVGVDAPVMPKIWEVVSGNTEDHWLELKDPEGWYYATVKWDGCIHFNRYFNMPKEMQEKELEENRMDDYIHICSVDDMIQRLQALRAEARKHFGEDWDS